MVCNTRSEKCINYTFLCEPGEDSIKLINVVRVGMFGTRYKIMNNFG